MPNVSVVVLGDIGRSPRMQYHALSLANEGYNVTVIGYKGSEPSETLSSHQNVKFQYVIDCPDFKGYVAAFIAYLLKTLWQSWTLLLALILAGCVPDFVLVQNPPAIPTLGVSYVFSRLTGAKFIIDWHNYAYTILSLSLGENHRLVQVCKAFEFWFGKRSDDNICVTRAMKDDLLKNYEITARVLYDRPPEHFRPISVLEKHDLLRALGQEYPIFVRNCDPKETIFTRISANGACLRYERPGLLISSTSWTEDEDFSLLLEALQDYEEARSAGKPIPHLIVVITGKGPLKEFYTSIIAKRGWNHIEVVTPWLTAENYPKILACGDLGVCLHISSSELDLPMKVVDMFGCGLPVAAVRFKCLDELVHDKVNGQMFTTSEELAAQLVQWFDKFPETPVSSWRTSAQDELEKFQRLRWHENWVLNTKPIFTH